VRRALATILKAILTRLFVGSRPFPIVLSPLILLSRHSRSQETKWSSVFHLLISDPASLRIVIAVMTSMPSMRVRSVPVMRNNPVRKSNRGLLPFFFLSRSLRFSSGSVALRSGLPSAGDTVQAVDRTRPSASGKTSNHPVFAFIGLLRLRLSGLPICLSKRSPALNPGTQRRFHRPNLRCPQLGRHECARSVFSLVDRRIF
jgi:hypothetical protein